MCGNKAFQFRDIFCNLIKRRIPCPLLRGQTYSCDSREIPSSQQGCNWQSVERGCEGIALSSDFKLLERDWINEAGFAGSVLISAHKF